jgi:hypothetical protein
VNRLLKITNLAKVSEKNSGDFPFGRRNVLTQTHYLMIRNRIRFHKEFEMFVRLVTVWWFIIIIIVLFSFLRKETSEGFIKTPHAHLSEQNVLLLTDLIFHASAS